MRVSWLILLSAILLGACVPLHSDKPIYSADDEAGAPRLRDGLWRIEASPYQCKVFEKSALRRWPKCANWWLVQDGAFLAYGRDREFMRTDDPQAEWTAHRFILASGTPRIVQIASPDDEDDYPYTYDAVTPLREDGAGRIVEAQWFWLNCGAQKKEEGVVELPAGEPVPPPPPLPPEPPRPPLTREEVTDFKCEVETRSEIAGFLSRRLATFPPVKGRMGQMNRMQAKWVRDIRPDDFAP